MTQFSTMEISTKNLRTQTKQLFNAIDRGEEVILTYHGKQRARIVGLAKPDEVQEETPAYGIWKDRDDLDNVDDYVRNLRKGRQF